MTGIPGQAVPRATESISVSKLDKLVRHIALSPAITLRAKHDRDDGEETEHRIRRAVLELLGNLCKREHGILRVEAYAPRAIDVGPFTAEAAVDAFPQE
jgi:hypothetical protein